MKKYIIAVKINGVERYVDNTEILPTGKILASSTSDINEAQHFDKRNAALKTIPLLTNPFERKYYVLPIEVAPGEKSTPAAAGIDERFK